MILFRQPFITVCWQRNLFSKICPFICKIVIWMKLGGFQKIEIELSPGWPVFETTAVVGRHQAQSPLILHLLFPQRLMGLGGPTFKYTKPQFGGSNKFSYASLIVITSLCYFMLSWIKIYL